MTKVLVTGASGFIGTHLVAALAGRGDEITCLVRKTSRVDHLHALRARLVVGDVTDCDSLSTAVAGQQVVYHVAGLIRALNYRQFHAVNCRGTAHVANACARQGTPPVLVHVSSLAAAGPAVDGRPRVESDPPAPVSHYGRSKWLGECAVEKLADRMPITIVRPPIVLGEGDRLGLSLFRSVVRFRVHVAPGIKSQRFSVVHADDLTQMLILAAERGKRLPPLDQQDNGAAEGLYFVASEQDPTYVDLGRMIAASVDQRVVTIPAVMPVVWSVAAVSEVISRISRQPSPVDLDKAREIAAGSWICSPQRAREELGFAVGAPLGERLRQTIRWYKQEGWL